MSAHPNNKNVKRIIDELYNRIEERDKLIQQLQDCNTETWQRVFNTDEEVKLLIKEKTAYRMENYRRGKLLKSIENACNEANGSELKAYILFLIKESLKNNINEK